MYNGNEPSERPQPERSAKKPLAVIIAIVLGVVVCCGGVWLSNTDFNNPTDTIRDNYTRAANLDEGGGTAYTSSSSPATVSTEIDRAASAREKRSSDGVYYLQYSKHIVAVMPHQGGSKILLHDYRSGYNHYSSVFILWGWSSSPPSPFRGGGPGSGK
ncbi:DUF4247 domain-containing protein [Glycomyces sp. NPDC046736]|uniref:DUF4247 domain-containing protein n=1 Tax=Glycomyces sp. NPDC046736 TaxID=3155615 RepID=UPI0033E69A32